MTTTIHPTSKIALDAISELHREAMPVTAVYSGARDACACGCRGKHSSKPGTITLIKNRIDKAIREGRAEDLTYRPNVFVAVKVESRLLVAYVDGRQS